MNCKCGGVYEPAPAGLEGSFCNKCGAWIEEKVPDARTTLEKLYEPERIKSVRGIPTHEIVFGTEGRGKLKASIPTYATEEESKAIIDTVIELLKYTKKRCLEEGLDNLSKR